jgi:hypothetical protein
MLQQGQVVLLMNKRKRSSLFVRRKKLRNFETRDAGISEEEAWTSTSLNVITFCTGHRVEPLTS